MHGLVSGLEFVARGGFMMYPLLLAALLGLTVIVERIYALNFRYRSAPDFASKVFDEMLQGRRDRAESLCSERMTPVASLLAAGIRHLSSPREQLELVMKNQAEQWVPILEKRIPVLDTVITAAPLMGLLGTITGMMGSFQVLSEKGVNEPNAITGGVAEALIATATGLVVALICLVAYNYLSTQVKNSIYQLESLASQLVELSLAKETREARDHANSAKNH